LALLQAATPAPEALILGSSRIMNLAPGDIRAATGLVTFNLGVDIAKTEDFYCLVRYAVEHLHLRPKLIVIAVDIEAFHNHEPPHYYLRQPDLLGTFLWSPANRFWRWSQFTKLLDHVESGLSLESLYKIGTHQTAHVERLDPDGLTHFLEWDEASRAASLDRGALTRDTIVRLALRYDTYTALSVDRLAYFRATLEYAHDVGARAIVFLTPTQSTVEQQLQLHGYDVRKREVLRALQNMCQESHTPLFDFSVVHTFGGDESHFIDGIHHDGSFNALMIGRMLTARADAVQ
jgi:hypothetical protein